MNTNITYRQVCDYNIPSLILPPEEANITLGKWGMLHKDYLFKHKKVVFTTLLAEGKLWQYLADIDTQAQQTFDTLVEQMKDAESVTEQMKDAESVTEQMKEEKQTKWVKQIGNIHQRVREVVLNEVVYM